MHTCFGDDDLEFVFESVAKILCEHGGRGHYYDEGLVDLFESGEDLSFPGEGDVRDDHVRFVYDFGVVPEEVHVALYDGAAQIAEDGP